MRRSESRIPATAAPSTRVTTELLSAMWACAAASPQAMLTAMLPPPSAWHERAFIQRAAAVPVLAAYSVIVLITVARHEPWADEAQAWLLVRDCSLSELLFRYLRYEGTPGLWHVVLWLAKVGHAPYGSMGWIGAVFAIAGAAVWLKYSPLPAIIRFTLPFSFYFLYQYAAVARNYVLIPMFAFLAAHFHLRAREHTYAYAATLSLLANTSAHGMFIALGLAFSYLWTVLREWSTWEATTRKRHIVAIAIFSAAMVLVAIQIRPAPDAIGLQTNRYLPLTDKLLSALDSIDSGLAPGWSGLSFAAVALLGVWCWKRRAFIVFLVPLILLAGLYGFVYGGQHHRGLFLVAMMVAAWVSWPRPQEQVRLPAAERYLQRAVVAVLTAVIALHVIAGIKAVREDYRSAYCGGTDTAAYLRTQDADRFAVFGFNFPVVAIEPYFPGNIFSNLRTADGKAFRHNTQMQYEAEQDTSRIARDKPEFVVFGPWENLSSVRQRRDPEMQALGYTLVHSSPSVMYGLDRRGIEQGFLTYRRVENGPLADSGP